MEFNEKVIKSLKCEFQTQKLLIFPENFSLKRIKSSIKLTMNILKAQLDMQAVMQSAIYRKSDQQPPKFVEVKKHISINKTIVIKRAIKPLKCIKALRNNHESRPRFKHLWEQPTFNFLSVSENIWTIV